MSFETLLHQLRESVAAKSEEFALAERDIAAIEERLSSEQGRLEWLTSQLGRSNEVNEGFMQIHQNLVERRDSLKAREAAIDGEFAAAVGIQSHLEADKKTADVAFQREVNDLQQRYKLAMDAIAEGGKGPSYVTKVDALQSVLVEQDFELALLREVLGAATEACASASLKRQGILSKQSRVALPTASCIIPVPLGRVRRLTGASGEGLHMLRQKYLIGCRAVEDDAAGHVAICLWGHANGVRSCASDIEAILA